MSVSPVSLGPGGVVRDRAVDPRLQIFRSAQPIADTIGEPMPRLGAEHQRWLDERSQ